MSDIVDKLDNFADALKLELESVEIAESIMDQLSSLTTETEMKDGHYNMDELTAFAKSNLELVKWGKALTIAHTMLEDSVKKRLRKTDTYKALELALIYIALFKFKNEGLK